LGELAFHALLDQHLDGVPAEAPLAAAHDALLLELRAELPQDILLYKSGRARRRFRREDFSAYEDAHQVAANLLLLSLDFGHVLHAEWSWPRAQAEMARRELCAYLGWRKQRAAQSVRTIRSPLRAQLRSAAP